VKESKVNTTVDVTQVLIGYDNEPIMEQARGADGVPGQVHVTLRMILCRAIVAPLPGDETIGPDEKSRMFVLTSEIHNKDNVEFSISDLDMINKRVARHFGVGVVGPVAVCLNPATVRTDG